MQFRGHLIDHWTPGTEVLSVTNWHRRRETHQVHQEGGGNEVMTGESNERDWGTRTRARSTGAGSDVTAEQGGTGRQRYTLFML